MRENGRGGRDACRGYQNLSDPRGNICQPGIPYTWQADKLVDGAGDPPCIMQPRRAEELFFSRCWREAGRRANERPRLFRLYTHTTFYHLRLREGRTLRILLSGCSHRRSLRRLLTSVSHTGPRLIVLPRCTDYLYTACPTNSRSFN